MRKIVILLIFAILAIEISLVNSYRTELIDSTIKVNMTLKPIIV